MNPIDIGGLILMLVFAIRCAFRGFIEETLSMAAWILGGLAAFLFWTPVSSFLAAYIQIRYLPQALAIGGVFILVFLLVKIIEKALKESLEALHLGFIDHILGFLLGAVEGAIISSILIALIVYQPLWNPQALLSGSFFYALIGGLIAPNGGAGGV